MRVRITIIALFTALSLLGFGLKGDAELSRLIDQAKSAPIEQQPRVCAEIAELELEVADQLYSADQVEKARAAVGEVVSYADKASAASIQSGKRLKDTEIAMRKMSVKLRDMKRKLTFEDQAPLQAASDHLETLRTGLLAHMFKKKK
jgi:hypothetical protein